jgi:hypothetical protein
MLGGPASAPGLGAKVNVTFLTTAAQSIPVDVRVKVTDPAALSAADGKYCVVGTSSLAKVPPAGALQIAVLLVLPSSCINGTLIHTVREGPASTIGILFTTTGMGALGSLGQLFTIKYKL